MGPNEGWDEDLLRRQAGYEADWMAAEKDRAERAGFTTIDRREAIDDQPRELYRHPWHVEKTAPDLVGNWTGYWRSCGR